MRVQSYELWPQIIVTIANGIKEEPKETRNIGDGGKKNYPIKNDDYYII